DEEDYLKMLTGSINDETAYWDIPYEARIEEGEPNERNAEPRCSDGVNKGQGIPFKRSKNKHGYLFS
ncbi:9034_t:CDS:2, partial [Funneliformis caledonium]